MEDQRLDSVFVELPAFARRREEFLSDDEFSALQQALMWSPESGDLIRGTGGLRKLRWADRSNNKGKRGGARVIYYWHLGDDQFWLFAIYGKSDKANLSAAERVTLKTLLEYEVRVRRSGK